MKSIGAGSDIQIQELLQFMYLLPTAIVKFEQDGKVDMLTPHAVQLLEELGIDSGAATGTEILNSLSPGLAEYGETRRAA